MKLGSIRLFSFLLLSFASLELLVGQSVSAQNPSLDIPAGTVLPVRLNHGLSSKTSVAGHVITGRVMQDVPLPNNQKIPAGAKVLLISSGNRPVSATRGKRHRRYNLPPL